MKKLIDEFISKRYPDNIERRTKELEYSIQLLKNIGIEKPSTDEDWNKFADELKTQKGIELKDATIKFYSALLKKFFEWLEKKNITRVNFDVDTELYNQFTIIAHLSKNSASGILKNYIKKVVAENSKLLEDIKQNEIKF